MFLCLRGIGFSGKGSDAQLSADTLAARRLEKRIQDLGSSGRLASGEFHLPLASKDSYFKAFGPKDPII